MPITTVNAAGNVPHTDVPQPARFASMSRETARQQRVRAAIAIEHSRSPRAGLPSAVLYVLAALILIGTACMLFSSGPSDAAAAKASALSLQDAVQTARQQARSDARVLAQRALPSPATPQ